jgi:alpha-beta hydrolase superfamily lysophospholipase
MKNLFAFSLTLVAFSGGAGLGLSALHDYSTSVQTATLAAPELQNDAASGFVIPQFIPVVTAAAVTAPALPSAISVAAPEPDLQMSTLIRPRMRSDMVAALAPAVETRAVARSAQVFTLSPRAKARAKAPSTDYVSQAFITIDGFAPQNGPEYVVGVYR